MTSRHNRKGSPKKLKTSGRTYDTAVGNPPATPNSNTHKLGSWKVEPCIAVNPVRGREIEILGPSYRYTGYWRYRNVETGAFAELPEKWLIKMYYPKDKL